MKTNYLALLVAITRDFSHIATYKISWLGRIVAFKMLVLPKLLYYFRAMPIILLPSFFRSVEVTLKSVIWQVKKARIPYNPLIKHKSLGGVSLPIMSSYYRATILDQN